ncbi:flagellar motor switch phosphatase FliY [Atopococcus tabaci]|uniref:flagellar motor switch phosphatase FliY n=1 Tax=Atopococcus tabaci TaxID=269774 RepID=UPI0003FBFD19|nr:flagellar motor switch phosphatase FliY [Atopococcus tabaci]
MSEMLTQEEIDALMNGNVAADEPVAEELIDQTQADIIGEVGNISMSQAATTLSTLLNHQVNITTPRVFAVPVRRIIEESTIPKVVTTIEFKEGLKGSNMLMIDIPDANIIADLMMGNSGEGVADKEFTELELSAVGEAMNQMMGTASTAMATMFNRKVDINPPEIRTWDVEQETTLSESEQDETIVAIAFKLTVEGLLESEIMQIFPMETVEEIIDIMLKDEAVTLNGREVAVEEETTQMEPVEEKVEIQKPAFQELSDKGPTNVPRNLDLIMDVPLEFSVLLGKSKKTIKDILSLGAGSVVELDKMTDEPLEIYVNGQLIAEGEVVVINESFGIRITNILSKAERIRHLN